jgi:hypothetical protein
VILKVHPPSEIARDHGERDSLYDLLRISPRNPRVPILLLEPDIASLESLPIPPTTSLSVELPLRLLRPPRSEFASLVIALLARPLYSSKTRMTRDCQKIVADSHDFTAVFTQNNSFLYGKQYLLS